MKVIHTISAAIFAIALMLTPFGYARAEGSFNDQQKKEIGEIIRNYLLENPDLINEVIGKLQAQQQQEQDRRLSDAAKAVKPLSAEDHVLGNRDAPVKVIEFSDFECPFCKSFHSALSQMMDEYGSSGQVAWVYRHFPLDQIHSKARKEAQAAECANELGGNDAFWAYANKIFEVTPSNNELDLALLPQLAEEIGLDRSKFETCLQGDEKGGKYADHIEANLRDAVASGGNGTPFTLVISPAGDIYPLGGAQPYDAVKAIIDTALAAK